MNKPSDKFYAEITIKVHNVDDDGIIWDTRTRSIMHSGTGMDGKLANECASRTKVAIDNAVACMTCVESC